MSPRNHEYLMRIQEENASTAFALARNPTEKIMIERLTRLFGLWNLMNPSGDWFMQRDRLLAELPSLHDKEIKPQKRRENAEDWFRRFLKIFGFWASGPYRTPPAGRPKEQTDDFFKSSRHRFLTEIKARRHPIDRRDMALFVERIRPRRHTTHGFFVAHRFTKGAIQMCAESQLPIILVEFDELERILKSGGDIEKWLEEKIDALAMHRCPLYRPGIDPPLP